MSSIIQTESTLSNFQLIVNEAFANYTKQTGIDLSNSPFAEKLQVFSSPAAVLEHLREQENAFKEYRDGDRRLIACLSPAVPVLCAFAATLGEPQPPSSRPLVRFFANAINTSHTTIPGPLFAI